MTMMKTITTKKKLTHGGMRKGAGRHRQYGEKTTTIAFRVPISKAIEIKDIVSKQLKKYTV